eukprot:9390261-Prorocentrum_lima.AAC.1
MTSSLVGSEMCIRDRQLAATPGVVRVEVLPEAFGWVEHLLAVFEEQPVSYTHLTLPTICSV